MLHLNNGQEQQLLLQTTSQFKPTLQKWAQLWRRTSGTALKVVGIRNLTYYILSYSTFIYQHKIEHGWNLRLKVSFIIRTYFFIEIHPCPRNRLTKKVIFITEYVVVVKMNSVHAGPLFTFIFRPKMVKFSAIFHFELVNDGSISHILCVIILKRRQNYQNCKYYKTKPLLCIILVWTKSNRLYIFRRACDP